VSDALLSPDDIARLREALTAAHYTATGIADRIGPVATAAMARNDMRAALRATARSGDPLATLIRVFVCGQTEPVTAVAAALAPLALDTAVAAGLVEFSGDGLRAGLEIEAYGDQWVVSDVDASMRPGRPLPPEHVLGVGGASTTLAQATIRRPVARALDLGTGCGIQALHLSTHARRVTATDLSTRALRFAATTAQLNQLDWELLAGDLTAPVADRRFDLVVSNPPFVVGPGTTTHTYRDSGRPGDAVCAELAAAAPGLLADGGYMQFLANWLHLAGEDWTERVAGWVADTGLDAWIVQREVSDPVSYVNLWLADAAEAPGDQPARAAEWLDWFDANKIEAVGLGLVTLRAAGHDVPSVRVEDLRQPVDQPLGEHVVAWFERQDWLRGMSAETIMDARLRMDADLQLRQEATHTADGWQVDRQLLAQTTGLRWVEQVDPVVLALVSACDGTRTLGDQIDVLAAAHEVDPATLAEAAVPVVAHLVERAVLLPARA
jgi:methylase of polypeptide subunit release factors